MKIWVKWMYERRFADPMVGQRERVPAAWRIRLALGCQGGHFFSMRPTEVEPLAGYRIRLKYPDGVEGVIDLSGNVGHGIFAALADEAFFRTVHIGRYGQIAWSEDIELCPDAAYEDITGKPTEASHARG